MHRNTVYWYSFNILGYETVLTQLWKQSPFYELWKVRLTEEITDFKILTVVWESRTGSCDYSYVNSSFSGKF